MSLKGPHIVHDDMDPTQPRDSTGDFSFGVGANGKPRSIYAQPGHLLG
eukprot:CAMPEP_0114141086 /NCGR_PEP_ID=MMETSP0043_2-20121206/17727_1 /TAXON_ID=464988 /ORGANISM="Hemiselmis andersenii, Strain CCMP644" /LENGTH=47 /DNA_ID= /DNA_START= /DNA_END= /DNA_ORIENTATION=